MLEGLRAGLRSLGLTPFDIQLPDEDSAVAPLEGALRVSVDDPGFVLDTVDYGRPYRLLSAESEPEISDAVLGYVSRPLPPVRALPRPELDTLAGRVAHHYADLRRQLEQEGGFVIDLPPALPLDRIGALDGVHTYPLDTPFEHRSLPPNALRPENDVHQFLTTAPVRVWVAITQPWFGRPGGGIRFTLQEPATGLRDLVVSGRLQRVRVVG
jgi:hypothetical protein